MENQKEKLREPRRRYTLCVMWNEGNPKEVANCDVNGKKKYIEKKEWSEEEVGLDSALPKTARRTNQKKQKKTNYLKKLK